MKPLTELIEPVKSALVIIDVQNDFCHPDGVGGKRGFPAADVMAMIPRLQNVLAAARASGTRVIFVQTIHESATDSETWTSLSDGNVTAICRKDTWGAEFTGVQPLPDEPVVVKHRYSAFINTRLESVLRTLKVENLIMAGVSTNVCVESTARHGFMLDYNIVLLADCAVARDQAAHDATLTNIRRHFGLVATSGEVIGTWRSAAPVPAST